MPEPFIGQRVEATPGAPLPYGLITAATPVLVTDLHDLNGVEWEPMSCAEAQTTSWCPPPEDPKLFTSGGLLQAQPVTVYYGYKCPPVGKPKPEADTYARAGLAIGEPRALEAWVQENVLVPAATNLTPGGPLPVPSAVSLLEGTMAVAYGGVGVIHAPAGASALLAAEHQLVKEGARMLTWLGNRVALGAGYQAANLDPNGDPAEPGTFWLYISGPVTVLQEQPDLPGRQPSPPSGVEQAWQGVIDTVLNDRYVLAERTSVVMVECGVFAVQIEAPEAVS
jgi:hypothetical protein